MESIICNICGFEITKRQLTNHIRACEKGRVPKKFKEKRGKNWLKGKTYLEEYGLEKTRMILDKQKPGESFKNRIHTKESRNKISCALKGNYNWKNSLGKAGKGKKGKYKGVYFDSTWELAYMIYCEDFGINIRRNWDRFPYEIEGETRYYVPDFFLIESNKYLEIKGYKDYRFELKMKYFNLDIEIYDQIKMKPIIDYVINKYGKKFYEDKKDK